MAGRGKPASNKVRRPHQVRRTRCMEQEILEGEARLRRILERLLTLPGRVTAGRTSDTRDRYLMWYPFEMQGGEAPGPETQVSVQWLVRGDWHGTDRGKIEVRANLPEPPQEVEQRRSWDNSPAS